MLMKNQDDWTPSKYIHYQGRLRASRNAAEVQVASRLYADLVSKHLQAILKEFVSGRLLDLGCGKVPLYAAYKDYTTSILCTDWQFSDYIDFRCDLSHPLPIKEASFQTIVLTDVLEHIVSPQELWIEMSRILSVHGIVILSVPFYYGIHEAPHDYYRYTIHALEHLATSADFEIQLPKPIGGAPEILADLLAKHCSKIPFIGNALATCIQYLTFHFVQIWPGKVWSERSSRNFPLGYLMVARKRKRAST